MSSVGLMPDLREADCYVVKQHSVLDEHLPPCIASVTDRGADSRATAIEPVKFDVLAQRLVDVHDIGHPVKAAVANLSRARSEAPS